MFCKKLVLLNQNIELSVSIEELAYQDSGGSLLDYFSQLGFKSLVARIAGQQFAAEAVPSEQADILFLTNKEEAIREKQELSSSKLKVGFDLKPLVKELKKIILSWLALFLI